MIYPTKSTNYNFSFQNLQKTIKMTSSHKFLLLLLRIAMMSFSTIASPLKEQRFAMEPQDQTAVVGSRVTLPCRVIDKLGILQWTKDDFGLGTHRNLTGFERYSMIGSDEEGQYSFLIWFKTTTIFEMYIIIHQMANALVIPIV